MNLEKANKQLQEILSHESVKFHSFSHAELYVIDDDILAKLLLLDRLVAKDSDSDKAIDSFWHLAKILNPDNPAYKFEHYTRHKYKIISDQEKVKHELNSYLNIWENKKRKSLKQDLLNGVLDEVRYKELLKEFENKLEFTKVKLEAIREDFESYDVVITNFKDKLYYSEIYVAFVDETKKSIHLRSKVPNILWLQEDNSKIKGLRSDSYIQKLVAEYNVLEDEDNGTIYYKKRDEL